MPLILYRRHKKNCDVHKLGLPARAKRLWAECQCPIWMYGRTDTSRVSRQSTGYTDMAAAQALRASLDAKGKDERVHGPRIADCIALYIDSRRHELAQRTLEQHVLVLGRLATFTTERNLHFMRDLNVDVIETFKIVGLPGLADTSRRTCTAKVRCFLKDALRRGWIAEALAEKIRPHSAQEEMKDPYTDGEVQTILNGAAVLRDNGRGRYSSQPQTFRLLLELMLATGMRAGDAVRYDPAAAAKGERLWIYSYTQQKAHRNKRAKIIEAYVPDRLKAAIDSCHWLSPTLPFAYGAWRDATYLAHEVYNRMQTIGAATGVADCRPHRLRDTFAVRALLRGVPLDDVSRLLGHSSVKITETYYAKWVPARGRRLERLVAESLMDPQGD
jgi:integrase/recombinase XerD